MSNIVKAELYKFLKSKSIKVLLTFSVIWVMLNMVSIVKLICLWGNLDYSTVEDTFIVKTGFEAFSIMDFNSLFYYFIPFLIVFFFTSDFSKKTIRNLFTTDLTRNEIFVGKYIAFSITVVGITLFMAVFTTLVATIMYGWGTEFSIMQILNILFIALRVGISHVSYSGLAIVLSILIHNETIIVISYFAISILENILLSTVATLQSKSYAFYYLGYIFPSTYMDEFSSMQLSSDMIIYSFISIALYCILTIVVGTIWFNRFDINE